MAVSVAAITKLTMPSDSYLIVAKDAITGVCTVPDGVLYTNQADAAAALTTAAGSAQASADFLILHCRILSGKKAVVV